MQPSNIFRTTLYIATLSYVYAQNWQDQDSQRSRLFPFDDDFDGDNSMDFGKEAENYDSEINSLVQKRAPISSMGLRGWRPYAPEVSYPEAVYKRAPTGFIGMRGKKNVDADLFVYLFPDSYPKRRVPTGFFGMRGKKDVYKFRKPMGFMGMRGKKWSDDSNDDDLSINKRRVPTGFFGMRGKKQDETFVGVPDGKSYPLSGELNDVAWKHLMWLIARQSYNENNSNLANDWSDENDLIVQTPTKG